MIDWPEKGSIAPDFTLHSDDGETLSLSQFQGRSVVLYFYPKDDTPGCTRQACGFRDAADALARLGTVLLGVSGDSAESHAKFKRKYSLNFPLLVDADHEVAKKYGAWREKNMYGKKSVGIQRSTFLIDPHGKIAHVWKRVQVAGHDQQVLRTIEHSTGDSPVPRAP